MYIPFGVFSAGAEATAPAGSYDLISTTLLGSDTSSVSFSSLGTYSSTYKHLQVRMATREDGGGTGDVWVFMRLNSDSGSNYANHYMRGTGSAVQSGSITSTSQFYISQTANNGESSGIFGGAIIDIVDAFSTSKNKTLRSFTGVQMSVPLIGLQSGAWLSTTGLTTITFTPQASNFKTGSRFSLYGIKG